MAEDKKKLLPPHGYPYGLHAPSFYPKCMFGGALACGLTHAAVVSLDVAKCRAQAHSKAGRWPKGLIPGLKKIYAEEGLAGMRVGWVPTLYGYGAQGLFKFGLNEFFKDFYTHLIGADNLKTTGSKMAMWAAASGSAEVFADIALCPFEMTKVKMQVTLPGQQGGLPSKFLPAFSEMSARKAETRFPFGSLYPLWGRQVPYTMIKFVGFYVTAEAVYKQIETSYGYKKEDLSTAVQLSVTFASGYWAGIFCAIATQPMDNLVSMKGIPENKTKPWGQMMKEMGTRDLFLKGLGTRVLMIGTLTGLQWWIYGTVKTVMGFGTQ
jgi:solute carrier family 25 phosphate transporter 3